MRMIIAWMMAGMATASLAGEPAAQAPSPASNLVARGIIETSGFPGGVCVQVGATDSRLLVSLADGGKFLVQGLALDEATVASLRRDLQAAGGYGGVSVDRLASARLPYVENLVNLLVVDGWAAAQGKGITLREEPLTKGENA